MASTPSPLNAGLISSNSTSLPSSPLGVEKTRRYDRQLRLWGDHGQIALERASVCLINATATGAEVLKSLVLPGCGAFTIVDGNKVTGEDVSHNFFLEQGKKHRQGRNGTASQGRFFNDPKIRADASLILFRSV